jgi:hypothetical protein
MARNETQIPRTVDNYNREANSVSVVYNYDHGDVIYLMRVGPSNSYAMNIEDVDSLITVLEFYKMQYLQPKEE